MLMAGVRHVPAPEVALILLLETVLPPLRVSFALGEAVRPATLIGGAVVVTTLIVHSALRLRDGRSRGGRRPARQWRDSRILR